MRKVQTKRLIAIAIACLFVGMAAKLLLRHFAGTDQPAQGEIGSNSGNALFNEQPNGGWGLWVYSKEGTCPSIRAQDQSPFVVTGRDVLKVPADFGVDQLAACMHMKNGDVQASQICQSGRVTFHSRIGSDQLQGAISFVLRDGSSRLQNFRAIRCEPAR